MSYEKQGTAHDPHAAGYELQGRDKAPSPSMEMEVVATMWKYHDRQCIDLKFAPDQYAVERGFLTEIEPLVTLSQAQSALSAMAAERDNALAEIERMTPKFVAYEYLESPAGRLEAEAQVLRLTEENEALRKERDGKTEEFRDKVALGATYDEIQRFRDGYPNPAGGSKIFYRYTIEQARYRYADAVIAARSTTKEKGNG